MKTIYISTLCTQLTSEMEKAIVDHNLANIEKLCIEVIESPFEEIIKERHPDCMVSAANSFGLMNGGVDAAITQYFGVQLMTRVQETILERFCGEQPVGTAFSIETNNESCPWLIHAPTMRVPTIIAGYDNVYSSTWAALLAMRENSQINSVIFPAMGAGCGQVPSMSVAQQMLLAISNFVHIPETLNWRVANSKNRKVRAAVECYY